MSFSDIHLYVLKLKSSSLRTGPKPLVNIVRHADHGNQTASEVLNCYSDTGFIRNNRFLHQGSFETHL